MALKQIGQRKVSSLTVPINAVTDALAKIEEISEAVQRDEWGFNYEENITLPLNLDGTVSQPNGAIEITSADGCFELVKQAGKLYDMAGHTNIFKKPLKVNIRWMRAWDDLPDAAQYYIAIKAAREFAALRLMTDVKGGYTEKDENDAMRVLLRVDTGVDTPTAFDAPDMWWAQGQIRL